MHSSDFPRKRAAFSLVEVALAIAVVSFAVIGILSLMSSGLGNYRQVMDTTICAQIAQRILNDAQQADFKVLIDFDKLQAVKEANIAEPLYSFRAPTIDKPLIRYFDEQGGEIVSANDSGTLTPQQRAQAVYWVNTRITPRPTVPAGDGKLKQVGMDGLPRPLGTTVKPTQVETPMAQVTVEVASNPNALDIPINTKDKASPRYNLFNAPAGVRVLTYSANVGRN